MAPGQADSRRRQSAYSGHYLAQAARPAIPGRAARVSRSGPPGARGKSTGCRMANGMVADDDQSTRDEYATYAAQIRDEYAEYSKEDYTTGRTKVLEHLKDGHAIYFTEYWRNQRQHAARANMEWELGYLSAGHVA